LATRRVKTPLSACLGCIAALLLPSGAVQAQKDFPNRPVRLVNPFAPGGSVDLVARSVAAGLTEVWGQQLIVDNRAGAGTTIGTEIVAKAEPDGYTMLCTSSAIAIMPSMYRNMRFDTLRDLTPIALAVTSSSILAVHPPFPPKTVKELITLAKAQPGQIAAASSGTGSTNHLILEMFKSMAQVDIMHVPYKGGGPAVIDLMSGQVKMYFNAASTILPLMKSGRVRGIATSGSTRLEQAPELPTVAESGLPGFEAATWYALYGPKNLPAPLVQRWNEAANRYLRNPQTQDHFRRHTMVALGGTPAEFAEYHRAETARWAKVMAGAGIKPQ
jgi:tripartite-type tricarboxylate transporter receptor subunit TctC